MTEFNRRQFLEGSVGIAVATSVGTGAAVLAPAVHAQSLVLKPENGAKLRVLRWSRFVQGDIDAYMVNVKKFTEKTGIEVRVDNEGWEDVRPKAAVAANTGADTFVVCRHSGREVAVVFRERHAFAPGSTIHLLPDRQRAHLFDAGTGQRLPG